MREVEAELPKEIFLFGKEEASWRIAEDSLKERSANERLAFGLLREARVQWERVKSCARSVRLAASHPVSALDPTVPFDGS